MPIYEWKCEACGQEWEELCPMAVEKAICPHCGHVVTERRISVSSFQLKGDWS